MYINIFRLYERSGKITAVKKAVKIYARLSILYGANLLLYTARTIFVLKNLESKSSGKIISRHKNSMLENKYILTGIMKARITAVKIIII